MARSAAWLILPSPHHADQEKEAFQVTAQLLAQSLDDLRLAECVARALHATGHRPLYDVEVIVHERLVTLRGSVTSYYLKQVAQAAALAVPGAGRVRNELTVSRRSN
jgi:osmotically-inducible protein OsmY